MTATNFIEPGIRPLCDALNAIPGVSTVYSCEGHWQRGYQPFVMFDAPNDIALRIHRLLGCGDGGDDGHGTLGICWWLQARFNNEGTLRYILEPNDRKLNNGSWWAWFKLNNELKLLASLIGKQSWTTTN
jgi:hypothetical protein